MTKRVAGSIPFKAKTAVRPLVRYGIAYVPESLVVDEISSGQLVQVLDDWTPLFPGYYLCYPSRRQNSSAFRVIVEALRV